MTRGSLQKYFKEKKAQIEESQKSRISEISKHIIKKRIDGIKQEKLDEPTEVDTETNAMTYISEDFNSVAPTDEISHSEDVDPEKPKTPEDEQLEDSNGDEQSEIPPTEAISVEYQNLVQQYEQQQNHRKELEEKIGELLTQKNQIKKKP